MTISRNTTLLRGFLASLFLGAAFVSSSPADTNTTATALPPGIIKSSAGFYHPGVLVNPAQLDFVKAKIAAGAEPWKSAFEAAKASDSGALNYIPHPWKTCECGPNSRPDHGCKDEQRDSEAAYTQALLWYFSGNQTYAQNAINIMDAWANTLTGGHTFANGPV